MLLWIHGGGWHRGDKADIAPGLIRAVNAKGYNVAAVNFRQAPEVHVPDTLTDLRSAIRFLRPRSLGLVAVMGGSLGRPPGGPGGL